MRTGYKVSDIMTANPIKINLDLTVRDCAELMEAHNVGSVIVVDGERFAGIVTEQDMVSKVVLNELVPSKTKVKAVMTPANEVISIEPNKDIYDALVLMKENNFRRLPVMTGGKMHGIITSKDILKIQPDMYDIFAETIELREQERKMGLLEGYEEKSEEGSDEDSEDFDSALEEDETSYEEDEN